MANQAFTTLATNPIKAQPVSAGKIIVRGTAVTNDDPAITIYGTVAGNPDTEVPSATGRLESETTSSFSAISQVIAASAAIGTISGYAQGTAAIGDIRTDVNPTDGDELEIGFEPNAAIYRFKDTMAAIGDVQIGATKEITSANLNAAINASGTPGTEYYAGTLANDSVTSTVDVNVLTITDRIKCNRQLPWVITESASNFSKRVPLGGVDGLLLFSISPGGTFAADALTFSTEDHLTATLPALMTGTSPSVAINGGASMLRVWGDNSIKFKVESSTDLTNWHEAHPGEQTLSASTMTYVVFAQLHEYIRFVITENLNTDDTILDARVIW